MQVPGTGFQVDAFGEEGSAYFLTHYHQDHLCGLGRRWGKGYLYASGTTLRLLGAFLRVPQENLHRLDPGESVLLPDGDRWIEVTAFDANHCPGALMLRFDVDGRRVLYTADFRLSADLRSEPALYDRIDTLIADMTFLDKRFRFPPQEEAIEQVLRLVENHLDRRVYLGIYTVGKNKLIEAIATRFGRRVYVTRDGYRAHRAMGLERFVTTEKEATNIHAYSVSYFMHHFRRRRRDFWKDSVVILPTGWAVDHEEYENGYYYVPYSEHCSCDELLEFIERVSPRVLIPLHPPDGWRRTREDGSGSIGVQRRNTGTA